MITLTADSVLELRLNAPTWIDDRAAVCAASLVHFDAIAGLLQFNTACAGSRNTWIQTVMYPDWPSIVLIRQPKAPEPWGPLYPETDEELDARMETERVEEETTILGNESWPEVSAKFPELINMDVQVHCNCPAFRYGGSQYNLEQRNTSIFPEGTPYPHTRDPSLYNVICKHLAAVFAQHF